MRLRLVKYILVLHTSYIIRTTKLFLHKLFKKQSYTNKIYKLTNSVGVNKLVEQFIKTRVLGFSSLDRIIFQPYEGREFVS